MTCRPAPGTCDPDKCVVGQSPNINRRLPFFLDCGSCELHRRFATVVERDAERLRHVGSGGAAA